MNRRTSIPEEVKQYILQKYDHNCAGVPDFECPWKKLKTKPITLDIDHIIPLVEGGTNDVSNLQCLCRKCHLVKSSKEARIRKLINDEKELEIKIRYNEVHIGNLIERGKALDELLEKINKKRAVKIEEKMSKLEREKEQVKEVVEKFVNENFTVVTEFTKEIIPVEWSYVQREFSRWKRENEVCARTTVTDLRRYMESIYGKPVSGNWTNIRVKD